MAAIASLSDAPVRVEPGGAASTQLVVRNGGNLVDSFVFRPIGPTATWIHIEPAELSLLPGANATVTVVFSPPRASDVAAGFHPYAIRVVSRVEDEAGSITVEGQLEVAEFSDRVAEILPRTSRGRRKAKVDLAVDNRGNGPTTVKPTFKQAEPTLKATLKPEEIHVPPGGAGFSRVALRAVKRHWRGTPVIHPYQMVLSEEWKTPLVTDGVHVQEPILSRALLRSFLLGLLGLALLVALWFALLKPTVRSQAKAVVKPEVAKVDQRLDAAGIPPLPTTIAASKGGGATTTTTTVVGGAGGTGAGGTGGVIDFRLLAGQSRTTPKNKTFSLTDMVFQNPKAAAGVLTISRVTGGSTSVLFSSELANFRDYDLHFVSPFIFPDGSAISVTVACTSDCTDVAVTFAGSER